ncbi:hypothetical protein DY000_02032714 [Brassica cretica]|uniref:Uncharacterized protein n=1 Tax=Brassica cretica TaxID=69181 RepID=A0ABQ7DMS7_BRACR|nr:hypothetical protein DY000_02032714 [Brassica cretica]
MGENYKKTKIFKVHVFILPYTAGRQLRQVYHMQFPIFPVTALPLHHRKILCNISRSPCSVVASP